MNLVDAGDESQVQGARSHAAGRPAVDRKQSVADRKQSSGEDQKNIASVELIPEVQAQNVIFSPFIFRRILSLEDARSGAFWRERGVPTRAPALSSRQDFSMRSELMLIFP